MDKVELTIIAIDKATDVIQGVSGALGGIGKLAAKTAVFVAGAAVAGVTAATALLASTIKPASDLNETMSKVGVVFGESSEEVIAFGKNAAKSLGMCANEALTAAGTYGNLLRSMELSNEESAKMSTTMVQLAGDLASFNNVPVEDALSAIRSGLVGENEPLKRFGVNLNAASLKAKALAMGLYEGKGELTAAAKAQAAYQIILEQTSLAQGDFSRTSEGMANSQRVLGATLENVRAKIGTALLPVIANLTGKLSTIVSSDKFTAFINTLADNIGKLALQALEFIEKIDWEKFFTDVQKGWKTFSDGVTNMWVVVEPIFKELGGVIGTVWDIIKDGIQPGDIENIMLLIGALGTRIKEWASKIDFGGIYDTLAAKVGELNTIITNWASDPKTMEAVQNAGITIGEYLGGAISLFVKTSVTSLGAWFSSGGFVNSFKPTETGTTLAQKLVEGFVTGFIKGLTGADLSPQVKEWLRLAIVNANPAQVMTNLLVNAIQQVSSNVTTLTRVNWQSVGQQMMSGIASGIQSGVQWIVDAATNAARQAYNAVSRALRIHSPSKVFEGVGENMMLGWGKGITSNTGTTTNAVVGAANGMVSTATVAGGHSGGGRGISVILNYSPTVSLADKNEAQERLLPFIRDGLRAAGVA